MVKMLHQTSLLAVVGSGEDPTFSPRTLRLWNTVKKSTICELNAASSILSGSFKVYFPFGMM